MKPTKMFIIMRPDGNPNYDSLEWSAYSAKEKYTGTGLSKNWPQWYKNGWRCRAVIVEVKLIPQKVAKKK